MTRLTRPARRVYNFLSHRTASGRYPNLGRWYITELMERIQGVGMVAVHKAIKRLEEEGYENILRTRGIGVHTAGIDLDEVRKRLPKQTYTVIRNGEEREEEKLRAIPKTAGDQVSFNGNTDRLREIEYIWG